MANKGGVWIDHRQAVIVSLDPEVRAMHVASHVEKDLRRDGDSPLRGPYEARQVPRDDRRQMALTGRLNGYYDAVISALGSMEPLLIFGPGEAKGEFVKRLAKHRLSGRIAEVQSADKMTDPQIAAKVREYFAEVK